MPVSDARVTDGVQDRQMLLELVNLALDPVGYVTWPWLVAQSLGQFVHRPPHLTDLIVYLLGIQILEGPCKRENC